MKSEKPNCYECIWRRDCPGDAHSSCAHPKAKPLTDNPLGQLLAMLAGASRVEADIIPVEGLNVTGSEHGIRNGWFCWPWNFDPIWLETCDGFERAISSAG